jgi:hypothetical protein
MLAKKREELAGVLERLRIAGAQGIARELRKQVHFGARDC